jgi:hypothetical protein
VTDGEANRPSLGIEVPTWNTNVQRESEAGPRKAAEASFGEENAQAPFDFPLLDLDPQS